MASRVLAVTAVMGASSFLLAACGGGAAHNGIAGIGTGDTTTAQASAPAVPSSSSQSGPTDAQLLTYAACMRAHGISDFPNPVPSPLGGYSFHYRATPGSDLDPNSPRNQAAAQACRKDVPPGISDLTPSKMAANGLKWSKCMRAHGEPDFPDPNGQGLIKITNQTGIMDPNSPQFQRALRACRSVGAAGFDIQSAVPL